ncbi:MAG: ACT domain-containing protein [Rhodoglobus sp.]
MTAISDLDSLLATMEPELNPGVFVFATVAALSEVELDSVIALMVEAEGLTAAFAQALGDEQISCNVIAGRNHDHIFVPIDSTEAALGALRSLQSASH